MQCGPDEPSWTWTQIWVKARMPDYSLNWTATSSAIQGWKKIYYDAAIPTEIGSAEAGGLSASGLPWSIDRSVRMLYSLLKNFCTNLPDYCLKWTARSSALHWWQRYQSVAVRPPEAGDLSASSVPWSTDRLARMPDSPLKSLFTKHRLVMLPRCEEISLCVNSVSIYEGGRDHYRVDRSP